MHHDHGNQRCQLPAVPRLEAQPSAITAGQRGHQQGRKAHSRVASLRLVLGKKVLHFGIAYPGSIPGKIVAAWRSGSIDVVRSIWILEELRRVLPRLGHRHAIDTVEIYDLVDSLAL